MNNIGFKYLYGPVYSWRMGMSLGVDPLDPQAKHCNFDCPYCQLGLADPIKSERKVFVSVGDILNELKGLPAGTSIDYVTFSGNGEPTLAENLGEMISAVKALGYRAAVITNASLMGREDVRRDLSGADLVLAKLEAADEASFKAMNRPGPDITFAGMLEGLRQFREEYRGRLALQIMFTAANRKHAGRIADLARMVRPDEVQLNTPLRPSPVRPLDQQEMREIGDYFKGLNVLSVYEEEKKPYEPWDEAATRKRHGRYKSGQ